MDMKDREALREALEHFRDRYHSLINGELLRYMEMGGDMEEARGIGKLVLGSILTAALVKLKNISSAEETRELLRAQLAVLDKEIAGKGQ